MAIHTDYLAELIATADSDDVKKVLEMLTKETDMIKLSDTLVDKFQAKQMEATTAYLNKNDRLPSAVKKLNVKLKNKTKKDFAIEIIKFYREIRPFQCRKCKDEYIPGESATEENHIQCIICEQTGHTCFKKEHIDEGNGIVYICLSCQKTMSKVEKVPKLMAAIKPTVTEEEEEQNGDHEIEEVHRPVEKTDKVCELYKEGKCPHGLVGRNCKDKHPKHCNQHCKYGECRWGSKCWFLHPKICENSKKTRICYNEDCKKTHLKGTRRSDFNFRPEEERDRRYHQQQRYRRNSVNVWSESRNEQYTPQNKQANEKPEPTDASTQSFLAKYMEGMKTELFSEMKTSISSIFTKMREENQQMMQYATRPIITTMPVQNHGLAQKQNPNTVNLQSAVYHNPAMYPVNQ